MKRRNAHWAVLLLLLGVAPAFAHVRGTSPDFYYAGGTELFPSGCGGNLELSQVALTFRCSQGSVTIPYRSITLMQYRPQLSSEVRHLKLDWKIKPDGTHAKRNVLFTVVYKQGESTRALVLKVRPQNMRPYLAEIELDSRKRIQVWDYRGYD
ncbi:MAG: hypothetical protein ACRD3D_18140 [Terriglobia bacterium]